MEDEDKNSKSLVLITRVGSTPTTGTKQAVRTFSGSGLLYFCCKSHLCVLRENADDGVGRGYLAGKIQMGIDIAGGADIAVPQPFLDLFQAHAVGVKQACAAMAQVVETDTLHLVCDQKIREMLAQEIGPNRFPIGSTCVSNTNPETLFKLIGPTIRFPSMILSQVNRVLPICL